jgi:hypothetical protein
MSDYFYNWIDCIKDNLYKMSFHKYTYKDMEKAFESGVEYQKEKNK